MLPEQRPSLFDFNSYVEQRPRKAAPSANPTVERMYGVNAPPMAPMHRPPTQYVVITPISVRCLASKSPGPASTYNTNTNRENPIATVIPALMPRFTLSRNDEFVDDITGD
jgi:hypothetical protein